MVSTPATLPDPSGEIDAEVVELMAKAVTASQEKQTIQTHAAPTNVSALSASPPGSSSSSAPSVPASQANQPLSAGAKSKLSLGSKLIKREASSSRNSSSGSPLTSDASTITSLNSSSNPQDSNDRAFAVTQAELEVLEAFKPLAAKVREDVLAEVGANAQLIIPEVAETMKSVDSSTKVSEEVSLKEYTNGDLLRFLRARKYDTTAAAKLFQEEQTWRFEHYTLIQCSLYNLSLHPNRSEDQYTWVTRVNSPFAVGHPGSDNVLKLLNKGFLMNAIHVIGNDLKGRPSMITIVRNYNKNKYTAEETLAIAVYTMEQLIQFNQSRDTDQGTNGLEQVTFVFDVSKFSMNQFDLQLAKQINIVLSNYYPERMAAAIILNAPYLFQSFFKIVKPFVDQKTAEKVVFATEKELTKYFPVSSIPTVFGGTLELENFSREY